MSKIYMRDKTAPPWDHPGYVENLEEFTLNVIIAHNSCFSIASVDIDDYKSVVAFPNSILRN